MNKRSWLVSIAFLLIGCHTAIEVTTFSSKRYPPTYHVDVFSDMSHVNKEYIEIGYVEARGREGVSKQELIFDMKLKSSHVGAHALVKVEFYETTEYNYFLKSDIHKPRAKAIMIRYKDHE